MRKKTGLSALSGCLHLKSVVEQGFSMNLH